MATPSTCNSKDSLARLWLHEACRVFADRLVCDEDRQQLQKMLVSGPVWHVRCSLLVVSCLACYVRWQTCRGSVLPFAFVAVPLVHVCVLPAG